MSRQGRSKPSKAARGSKADSDGVEQITDPRFKNIQTSALYRLPSKKNTHVALDSRFAHMLRDDRFTTHAKVDRYGRRLSGKKGQKELSRLYRTEQEPSSDDNVAHENDVEIDDEEVQAELARIDKAYDPARDGGFDDSSSEESDSDDDQRNVDEEEIEFPDQAQADAPTGEVSTRLAAVNMDWDNIRAMDIMAVLSSFISGSGRILNVTIYPSEFGKERMEQEDIDGPPREIFATKSANDQQSVDETSESDDDSDTSESQRIKDSILQEDEGEDFDSTQLRRYQIERLRYYYAVISCSSPECAKEIYDAVDGAEYLSSANFFDLRFVPDEMDFSDDKPHDKCANVPERYKPNEFVTDALQHSKVKLSWDAEDPHRKEVQRQVFSGSRKEISENDLKAYLASDSSDEESADKGVNIDENGGANDEKRTKRDAERRRMRELLGLTDATSIKDNEKSQPVGDMQITFTSGLSDRQQGVFETDSDKEETTIEKYARKEKERKARRKEKLRALDGLIPSANGKMDEQGGEDLGFNDPFFTAPEKDRAAGAAARKEAKRQKRLEREEEDARASAQQAKLESLMVADDDNGGNMAHFDMKDLEKGEKTLRKKGKRRGKLSAREQQAVSAKANDQFSMNVQDPRFQAVYERNEFAVDPSHPKFKQTEGMQALLQEHRRKRAAGDPDAELEQRQRKRKARAPDEDGVQSLLQKIKTKSR